MPVEYKQTPTPDEARFLRESQWIVGLSKGPAWAALKSEMERMVSLCREIVENSESSDPKVITGMHTRLKLTKAITSDIIKWVESTEEKREILIKQLSEEPDPLRELQRISDEFSEEIDEHNPDHAYLG